MTSHVERLLSKAALEPTGPYTEADLDAAEERLALRVAARLAPAGFLATATEPPAPAPRRARPSGRSRQQYAADLRTLCEVVVTRPAALNCLHDFLACFLPEPDGAAVLGSVLHLAGAEDSARFWWQYAAGAGDQPAAYCLYLHHQAHGEDLEARWWYHQADLTLPPRNEETTELERATALRVLRALRGERTFPQIVRAVLDYVPAAVGYVDDDIELPLPDADFTDRIEALLAFVHGAQPRRSPPTEPLPERKPAPGALAARDEADSRSLPA
ncbi:hypothetical protein WDH52_19500 [Streptomyces sp. TRM70308]|uniref:hypothetical protein n=1 Tax=Streptomyces sp. TRM70308 TaxID=3131932 RepID=UPI003CFE8473